MAIKLFTYLLLGLLCLTFTASAQNGERYLIRIDKSGKQEAMPLAKGEKAENAIQRFENSAVVMSKPVNAMGTIDTIRYNTAPTTAFTFAGQNVMLQWYKPSTSGNVKAIYWRTNAVNAGSTGKATVRGWYPNSKLEKVAATKYFGYYLDAADGDGGIQPFKPLTGDTTWHTTLTGADSLNYGYSPTGTEAPWYPGGTQVTLAAGWQGITLADFGDPMPFNTGQLFGFTVTIDDPKGTDVGCTVLAAAPIAAPYHSLKYYELPRNPTDAKGGWWSRIDYEWGMYVVVEYTGDRPPVVANTTVLGTTLKTTARTVTATITDDNPSGGAAGVANAKLFYKISPATAFDSVAMTNVGADYSGAIPGASAGSSISYNIVATDVMGNRSAAVTYAYKIFAKTTDYLLVYNNAQYTLASADLIYTSSSTNPKFDRWSAPSDGTSELGSLLALYSNVLVADGSYPSRDVYPALYTWLKNATTLKKANLFFTSQDYGCWIQSACADTSFAAGTLENDFFGVTKIGPQDLAPATAEFRMVPQVDTVTNYLRKWETDSGSTLWYYPTFELAFSGYQDAMVPKAGAVALFKSGDGTNVMGVKNSGATFNCVYLGFDAGALQFRKDTALAPAADPKYWWIVDVGSLSTHFFKSIPTSVKQVSDVTPNSYKLDQNYPNPFNPSTVINYSVPTQSNVEVAIYNLLGQKVRDLVNEVHTAGQYQATWTGTDNYGNKVASGVYFYKMHAGSYENMKKMMLLK